MQNDAGSTPGVFVHPAGLCESDSVGAGTRIWAFAHVLSGAVIGSNCNICDGAYVESGAVVGDRVTVKNQVLIFEGVTIEDDVFLGPGVVFTNDLRPRAHIKRSGDALSRTTVRRGATLGAGVVVVCGTVVGANAFVGAGTVVTRDIPAHAFMVGNPARQIAWACTCGDRLDDDLTCPSCGRTFAIDSHNGTAAPSLREADRVADPDHPTVRSGSRMYITLRGTPKQPAVPKDGSPAPASRAAKIAPTVLGLGTVSLLTDISSESVAAILPLYITVVVGLGPLAFGFLDGIYQGAGAVDADGRRVVGGSLRPSEMGGGRRLRTFGDFPIRAAVGDRLLGLHVDHRGRPARQGAAHRAP